MSETNTHDTPAPAVDGPRSAILSPGLAVIDHLMAGGELMPAQLPVATQWTPERKLAAAVLASALIEVRDHHGSRAHQREVTRALEWIALDDAEWPFSFVRLCELFNLEVEWVRGVVAYWARVPLADRKPIGFLYRQAA